MPFPFTLEGSFDAPIDHAKLSSITATVVQWLMKERARDIAHIDATVRFKAGVFRLVSGWNPLVAISSGDIAVLQHEGHVKVSYRLRFTEMFVVVTLAVVGFLGPPVWKAPNLSRIEALGFLAFAWLWLFGGNYILTRWRFPKLLRRVVAEVSTS